jgi:hypothetical protein
VRAGRLERSVARYYVCRYSATNIVVGTWDPTSQSPTPLYNDLRHRGGRNDNAGGGPRSEGLTCRGFWTSSSVPCSIAVRSQMLASTGTPTAVLPVVVPHFALPARHSKDDTRRR